MLQLIHWGKIFIKKMIGDLIVSITIRERRKKGRRVIVLVV